MSPSDESATTRLLYAITRNVSLREINWDKVAEHPIMNGEISNGHAARMRYSRFHKGAPAEKTEDAPPKSRKPRSASSSSRKSRVGKRAVTGSRKRRSSEKPRLGTPEMTPETGSGRGVSEPIIKPERSRESRTPFTPTQHYLESPSPSPTPSQNQHSFGQNIGGGMDHMMHSFNGDMYTPMIGGGDYGNGMGASSPMGMGLGMGMGNPFLGGEIWHQPEYFHRPDVNDGASPVKREPRWEESFDGF